MAKIWDEAKRNYQQTVIQRHPDASVLLKVEHVLRRSFSRIMLKTSVRYGNTETKRVKREEGNKKYLNILWDYAGSRIRDVVKSRYIFPKPVPIERSDGSLALGYHGSTKTPKYSVRHNHLTELDFGDMIRSPLMELARQCLKYGVPLKEAKKYIEALLFRLLPFMDYVYTERRSGRPNYVRGGLKELRIVIEQIKREYGTRNGQRQSITSEVWESVSEDAPSEEDLTPDDAIEDRAETSDEVIEDTEEKRADEEESQTHFLQEAITSAKNEGVVLDPDFIKTAEDLLESDTLTAKDSEELLGHAKEQSRRIGVRIHRFVSHNFQSPFSFNGIVYHGKEMAYDDSGLILLSEVPIDGGRGRADLVLARAKQLTRVDGGPSLVICEPFMVIDLKTKSAFDFDIYGIESGSIHRDDVVSEFVLDRRELTNDEWENVLTNTPDPYETEQLDAYEDSILTDYQNVMWKDVDAQKKLVKAVLVVDSYQDWKDISNAVLPLVLRVYNGCVDGTLSEGDLLFPSDDDTRLRIAMRMLSVAKPATDTVQLSTPIPLEPFSERVVDQKEFILYLTVPGGGSPSQSAAVIAERWHGLEFVHGLARHRDVYWFDLVGEYNDPILRKKQFRLRYQPDPIRRFFKRRVQVKDLSNQVEACIYNGERIGTLRKRIDDILREGRDPIIVVSGWETLRRSTPDSHHKYLDEIATTIIQALPSESTTLWFARPVPLPQSSTVYATRCVAPFYQGTLWQNFVNTIVWNVAMPPDRTGARAPTNDHERGIFIERLGQPLERMMIGIEPLRGWGKDFRSGGRKSKAVFHRGTGSSSPQYSSEHMEKKLERAMEFIPHLLSQNEYSKGPDSNLSLKIEHVTSGYDMPQDPSPMLSFRPSQVYAQKEDDGQVDVQTQKDVDGRVKLLLPMATINQRREYRHMELDVAPPKRCTLPPSEYYLSVSEMDDYRIALREIRYLRDTIKFLRLDDGSHLIELLDHLSEALDSTSEEIYLEDTPTLMNRLRLVRQILETNPLSVEVWERLLPLRSTVPRDLTLAQREHVTTIQKRHPDILVVTGNHLFLLILTVLGSIPDTAFTEVHHSLWDYVQPWHLVCLGLRPAYPRSHRTGRSVLDRHRLLKRLQQRVIAHNKSLDLQVSLTNVRFGQLIALPSSRAAGSTCFWLLFQRTPGIYDMNAALLSPKGVNPSLSPLRLLHEMVSARTYWSESNLNLLSQYAKLQGDEVRVPVMIADYQGLQVLWVRDREHRRWTPVGRVHCTTRRFEDVTLIRTISLSADPHLQPVGFDDVRTPIHQVRSLVDIALLILNKGLKKCTPAICKITLDEEERMYKITFEEKASDELLGELLINRTVDLLEILRRPDNECEPVIINGKRLIWNRFKDISYDEDVALLRPWVNRHKPFVGLPLKLPPTANELLDASKGFDMTLELYHDPWTCPLRHTSMEAIQKAHHRSKTLGHLYQFRYESDWAEPERVSNEPGIHHGSCWRVHVDSTQTLTPELIGLMEARFTDTQVRALLSSQELVYWSSPQQEWVTHTFKIVVRRECIEEVRESWHLRVMLEELTGRRLDPDLPGAHLRDPDRWSPFFAITPEYVTVGLREKSSEQTRERKIPERNVALWTTSEVQEFLEQAMKVFLEEIGVRADRRMTAAIREEMAVAVEMYGVEEDQARVEFFLATIGEDSAGGRVMYVVLESEDQSHKVPVTGHLHDFREFGRIDTEDFESEVRSILGEFNLSEEDEDSAVEECVRLMRMEKLIKR